jgi:hypothetical protein
MFYVYEIKLHIFQSLPHSIIFLFEKMSNKNYYCLTFVEFLCHSHVVNLINPFLLQLRDHPALYDGPN